MIYGAIDIGSNAGRLLIGNVVEEDGMASIKKFSLTRVPLRLGEDVFTDKKISPARVKMLIKTLKAYKHLMDVYDIVDYRACATSAMREAENRKEILEEIKKETGIKLEIIAGEEEAELIFSTINTMKFERNKSYLYIDVGGGSTEVSLLENGERKKSKSFKIGTLRILKGKVDEKRWLELKDWVKTLNPEHKQILAIGTGGNINRMLKINRSEDDNSISYSDIKRIQTHIASYSLNDRINKLGLRPDRADVIVPAADIYLAVMRYADVTQMLVPKVGLSDGIIYELYKKNRKK
ncbi:MAG TPA: ethanolamine ammonia-lyase reactivating factor EutA [Flavobacteriales bacterium]|nr:ethanolamine ammonia-lyase reactivating factor EutA [Flavobacteriales bacterium]HRJ34453.1 ethanolamine ammonia-lyase reactivating factor EutA [Flavobacteriales bacterium]HRJ39520.1 ethanolamine ammonia-lyase reactivating factor EutA [Flavobacteriales bacterium]